MRCRGRRSERLETMHERVVEHPEPLDSSRWARFRSKAAATTALAGFPKRLIERTSRASAAQFTCSARSERADDSDMMAATAHSTEL